MPGTRKSRMRQETRDNIPSALNSHHASGSSKPRQTTLRCFIPSPRANQKAPGQASSVWWRVGDLNPRPRRCERRALPTELTPHPFRGKLESIEQFWLKVTGVGPGPQPKHHTQSCAAILCLNARKPLRSTIGASNGSHHPSANSYHAAFDREPALREELDGLRIDPVLLDEDACR
jgi:hypothetical protein